MARTPDAFPGVRLDEAVTLDNLSAGSDPASTGSMSYVTGSFLFKDSVGIFNPRPTDSGSSLTYYNASSTGLSSTTSTSYVTKLTLTQTLTSGDYLVTWSATTLMISTGQQYEARFSIGSTEYQTHWKTNSVTLDTGQLGGGLILSLNGSTTFKIDFRKRTGGAAMYIYNAFIGVVKVS